MEQDSMPQSRWVGVGTLTEIFSQSRSVSYNLMAVVLSVQGMVSSLEEAVLARQGPEVQVKVKQWQPHPIV